MRYINNVGPIKTIIVRMKIVMKLSKNILKKICKYIAYILLIVCSWVIISIFAALFYYFLTGTSCDHKFVRGCMSAGLSEEACKSKIHG